MVRLVDKYPGKDYQPLHCRCEWGLISGKTLDSICCDCCGKTYMYYKLDCDVIYHTPKGELVPLKKKGATQ